MPSRVAAVKALVRVERDAAYATKALEENWHADGDSARRDRARAQDLVLGTLRWRGVIDGRLAPLLRRGIDSLDEITRAALRVAVYELLTAGTASPHGPVDAAVELVKQWRGRPLANLANAVLRRLGALADRTPADDEAAAAALPSWLAERLAAAWGPTEARGLALASLEPPPRTLRLNRRRGTTRPEGIASAEPSPRSPWILRLAPGAGDLRAHPRIADGSVTVQEEGAFLVAELLPLRPSARVLDACAGRGGKTGALAERLAPDAVLTAADVNPDKLARVALELARLGAPPAHTAAVDWTVGDGGLAGPFDAILLDAPCTGTGTLARRPEIKWRLAPADPSRLAAVQDALLRRLAERLAPGGTLVYAVCSLLPEEGVERIRALLADHPGLAVDEAPTAAPPWRPVGPGGALLPHASGTDGFYAAVLRRGPG